MKILGFKRKPINILFVTVISLVFVILFLNNHVKKWRPWKVVDSRSIEIESYLEYERNWTPKNPWETNVALVMPFVYRQKNRMSIQFSLWNSLRQMKILDFASMDACNLRNQGQLANFTLVWYIDTVFTEEIKTFLVHELFQSLGPMKDCFKGRFLFLEANLSPQENKHPCGPCAQFFALFQKLPVQGFDYFFLMEPDVLPIRPHWLDAITHELPVPWDDGSFSPSSDFWMKGSPSMCNVAYGEIGKRGDLHINGNALFKLGDPRFEEYMAKVKEFYPSQNGCQPGCHTGIKYEGGHDHTLFQFRYATKNFAYARTVAGKFQQTPIILNYCEDTYKVSEIRHLWPQTYLVHSKGPYKELKKQTP